MNLMKSLLTKALAVMSATVLISCNSGPFSGSGAMRIEVEVYKGPLSQEPEIQWGELVGYLEESKRSLIENLKYTLSVVANKNFDSIAERKALAIDVNENKSLKGMAKDKDTGPPMYIHIPVMKGSDSAATQPSEIDLFQPYWCDSLDASGLLDQLDYFDCIILRGVYVDSLDLIRKLNQLLGEHYKSLHNSQIDTAKATDILRDVAEFSSALRAKGFRWAVASTAGQSFNLSVRIAVFNFVVSASEFGNQLQARADTLMKQFSANGHDRRELPLSSYLRETGPTDFVHLYDWMNGSIDAFRYNLPEFLFTGMWPASVGGRVKVVDRLFADHFWSRINMVYTSGKGHVGMAFVKDELGNWNLKNFDNAPGELLDAYMQLGTSLVKKAGQMALAVNSGGGTEALNSLKGIQALVQEAHSVEDSLQSKPNVASESRSRLKSLEDKTVIVLNTLADDGEQQDIVLREKLKMASNSDRSALEEQLINHRQKMVTEFRKVIEGYGRQVTQIEKASFAALSKDHEAKSDGK